MSDDSGKFTAKEARLASAIAAYLEAADAGRVPETTTFLSQYSDLADELAPFLENSARFRKLAMGEGEHSLPRAWGEYELHEEIARGGMGVIYRARHRRLQRWVALKMILAGQLASTDDVERFRAEARAAAQLDHPGIVPIYEIGEYEGQHYYTMPLVIGESLAGILHRGPLPARDAAWLMSVICNAVQYAHDRQIIHRDLKPANILLQQSEADDRPFCVQVATPTSVDHKLSSLRPRITDFGLAKCLAHDIALTTAGQILGTPSYMSPEQTTGHAQQVGFSSDVYSLGAILYHMITGRPPHQAESPLQTLRQVAEVQPVPPRLLNRDIPRSLEAICMRCLEKDPRRRYPSAEELAQDLDRFLQGDTVHAKPIQLLERLSMAIQQSYHEEHFRGWGLALVSFGAVILFSHIVIYLAEATAMHSPLAYFFPRLTMFAALMGLLLHFRRQSIWPTNAAERLVWVVWTAYLLSLGAVNATNLILGREQRESYATFAILAGVGFMVMGGHVWGGGYVIGMVFLVAAPALAYWTAVAPIAFGALWAAALAAFGVHYMRREAANRSMLAD